jgi:hypothetical protein
MSQVLEQEGSSRQKGLSVMRYDRIQSILEADPALRTRLGPKNQEIVKRNGDTQRFSKGVIDVAERLHQCGLDAHNAPRVKVLAIAIGVLNVLQPEIGEIKPPVEVPPEAVKPEPIKRRRRRRRLPDGTLVDPPDLVSSLPPGAVQPTSVSSPPLVADSRIAKPESPAPELKSAVAGETHVEQAKPVPAAMPAIYPFISVLSLLHSAYNLLKLFDREPVAEKRLEALAEQIDEMYCLKDVSVPMPLDTLPPSLKYGKPDNNAAS